MSKTKRCLGLYRRHLFAIREYGQTVARYPFCVRCAVEPKGDRPPLPWPEDVPEHADGRVRVTSKP